MGSATKLRFGGGEWVAWTYAAAYRVRSKLYPAKTSLTYEYDSFIGHLLWSQCIRQAKQPCDLAWRGSHGGSCGCDCC